MSFAAALAGAMLAAASQPVIPSPSAGPSPIRVAPLAPGEVLVEVQGIGFVRTPATHAVLTLHPRGTGTSPEEAQRALEATVRRLTAQLRALGVAPDDIQLRPVSASNADLRTFDVEEAPPPEGALFEPDPNEANAIIAVTLREPARFAAVQEAVAGSVAREVSTEPRYRLADDSVPRREARRLAMAGARADAEAYAAALGMRVARIVRVNERGTFDLAAMLWMDRVETELRRRGPVEPGLVETIAGVGVDYVLAPR